MKPRHIVLRYAGRTSWPSRQRVIAPPRTCPVTFETAVPLNTIFLLMAQYNARVIIPLEEVCRDYFSHLTPEKFLRKVSIGEIQIPIVKIECSQKSAKGIHLNDLAEYLDRRRAEAMKELHKLNEEPAFKS
jgi:hypothetical protein